MDASHTKSVERFIDALNWLRLEAGNPSLRRLVELSGSQFTRNALDDHLSHRRVRLPPWELVAAYVTACHKAATLTGLDAKRLGTLKEWHERYLVALTGGTGVSGLFAGEVIPNDRDSSSGPEEGRVTTRLKRLPEPASTQGRGPNSSDDRRQDGDIVHPARDSSDPVTFGTHIHDIGDEVEVAAQGAGKWSVRWLPHKPSSQRSAGGTSAPEEESTESTEPLSSSNAISLVNPSDLAVSLAVGTALLLIKRGIYTGSQFLIDQDRTTIGRDPASDVHLDDPTVSRAHSVIYKRSGRFSVRDAGSLNSTYLNRRAIAEEFLKSGDELQIGVFRFLFLQGY